MKPFATPVRLKPLVALFVPPPLTKFTVPPVPRTTSEANVTATSWFADRVVRTTPSPVRVESAPDPCSSEPAAPALSRSNVPPRSVIGLAAASVPVVTFSDRTPPAIVVVPV